MPEPGVLEALRGYGGPELRFMEVCGTHTAAIFRHGIRSMISPSLRLVSGPGCPVCVTPAAYIDRAVELALEPGVTLATFGDMMKVPGSRVSLDEAKGEGARVMLMYAPGEALAQARAHPERQYVVAAVGFETTAPVYALALEQIRREGLRNVRLLTALRRVIPVLRYVCDTDSGIHGFLAPGHVSTVIGADAFRPLARRYGRPFVVAGFGGEDILRALYALLRLARSGRADVLNAYPAAVRREGNPAALGCVEKYFTAGAAEWRGMGEIPNSGYYLREEYREYDAGSRASGAGASPEPGGEPAGCKCGEVILGRITPPECPLFRGACTPLRARGPCMVSAEGTCGIWYRYAPRRAAAGGGAG
ncbi:MAG: hydrogenase formation protein HypD [Gracilibacteraceae bacterium]|jgi:hydrogenase expression/formation protein HypD|nr:hydrogenase formation protein HypD [Gracilibacteraceae bacterium]